MTHIFIGRERHINKLNKDIFAFPHEDKGECISIYGPHGIGKTFLIHEMCIRFSKKTQNNQYPKEYVVNYEINNSDTDLVDLMKNLLKKISDTIDDDILEHALSCIGDTFDKKVAKKAVDILKDIYRLPEEQPNTEDKEYGHWRDRIYRSLGSDGRYSIFKNYTQLGIRVILTFDEFDRAYNRFPKGDIFTWLYSLSNKSSAGMDLNMSIILISRKRVGLIAHHMEDGSNFEDAYPPYLIGGFDLDELGVYFQTYKDLYMGIPTDDIKKTIMFLCGRHPGLLMKMRKELEREDGVVDANTVERVWYLNRRIFHSVYERMCNQLQNEMVGSKSNISLMDAMQYQFELFATMSDSNNNEYSSSLIDSGYATSMHYERPQVDEESECLYYPDIFVLSGVKKIQDARIPLNCEPLSPYLLQYLNIVWKPDRTKGTADHLGITERKIRAYLHRCLEMIYQSGWEDHARNILSRSNKGKLAYYRSLKKMVEKNGYDGKVTILDVMGFGDYFDLIKENWDDMFKNDFNNYGENGISDSERLDYIKSDMEFLRTCRNAASHQNIIILNNEQLERIDSICSMLDNIVGDYR